LGHLPCNGPSAQAAQKVHSNEQMRTSVLSGDKSLSQRSQLGLNSSIDISVQPMFLRVQYYVR
jgi:hypothetical protein